MNANIDTSKVPIEIVKLTDKEFELYKKRSKELAHLGMELLKELQSELNE